MSPRNTPAHPASVATKQADTNIRRRARPAVAGRDDTIKFSEADPQVAKVLKWLGGVESLEGAKVSIKPQVHVQESTPAPAPASASASALPQLHIQQKVPEAMEVE